MKENTIRTKNALEHVGDRSERSPDEYAQNQVMDKGSWAVKRIAEGAQKQGDRLFHHGVNQYRNDKRTDGTAAEASEAVDPQYQNNKYVWTSRCREWARRCGRPLVSIRRQWGGERRPM